MEIRPGIEVFLAFLKQGLTAFGGPVAHLAYFRREFVERRDGLLRRSGVGAAAQDLGIELLKVREQALELP